MQMQSPISVATLTSNIPLVQCSDPLGNDGQLRRRNDCSLGMSGLTAPLCEGMRLRFRCKGGSSCGIWVCCWGTAAASVPLRNF